MRRMLGVDPMTGTAQFVDYDDNTDTFRIVEEIEAQPLLERNRMLFNEPVDGWGSGRTVASIPLLLWQQLMTVGIMRDEKALRRWLNDPDNRAFRTRPGRL